MRSILLITLEYPPQVGGIAEYLANLVAHVPGITVNVLAPDAEGAHEGDMAAVSPVYRRKLLWSSMRPRWLPSLYWADWLVRKENPALVLVSHLLPMGNVAHILRTFRRVPYAVIVHGMDVALALSHPAKRRAAKRILRDAAFVVANSTHTARFVVNAGVADGRVVVLPPSPGFDAASVPDPGAVREVRERYGLDDAFTVVSVGRLVARKGFDDCLRAVAACRASGEDVRYLIVGDGPERGSLERLTDELDMRDAVRFAGTVLRDELPSHFCAGDVFVMVPRSIGADIEGFGTVYLEANVLGRPVIGSRAGGVTDAVVHERTGLLVDPGAVEELAGAILRMKRDPGLRARFGEQGRHRVMEEFGWERHGARFVETVKRNL